MTNWVADEAMYGVKLYCLCCRILRQLRVLVPVAVLSFASPHLAEPTQEDLEAASLLASRATFGMTYEQITEMAEQGLDEWLQEQLNMECTSFTRWEDRMVEMYEDGELDEFIDIFDIDTEIDDPAWAVILRFGPFDTIWYMAARYGPDQLCQRVAWALSQIFVVSDFAVGNNPYSYTSYYDILLKNAFGNYRELIEDVTYSAQMGVMLSHVNNSRARPEIRLYSDEKYARELMQLFSVGAVQLNIDGTMKTEESVDYIPAYDAEDIANLARVMTGFAFDGEHANFGAQWTQGWDLPMMMFEWHHDHDEKVILGDTIIPAGQRGRKDVSDALDAIHEHSNVGPFIGKALIQRLVTSNPDPEYVQRVAEAFNDDGQGVRGNLKHVVKTILTDPEAANPAHPERFGKLREPVLRVMNLHRMFPTSVVGEDTRGLSEPFYVPNLDQMYQPGNQRPLGSPTVFNFYSPFHSPQGGLSDNKVVAPEFQILDMKATIELSNTIWQRLVYDDPETSENRRSGWFVPYYYQDESDSESHWAPLMTHDISGYVDLAETPSELVDRLDLVMSYGRLNGATRTQFIQRIEQIPITDSNENGDLRDRVWFAIWYMSSLPDYIVETYQ